MIQRLASVKATAVRLGVSKATLYRMVRAGTFPKQVRISLHRVGFVEHEVDAWIKEKMTNRNLADSSKASPNLIGETK